MNSNPDSTSATPPPPQPAAPQETTAGQTLPPEIGDLFRHIARFAVNGSRPDHNPQHAQFNDRTHTFVMDEAECEHGHGERAGIVLPPGHTAFTWGGPVRKPYFDGTVALDNKTAFLAYVFKYADPATLAIYADGTARAIWATMDHHKTDCLPGRYAHRVTTKCVLSESMQRMEPKLNKWLSEQEFIDLVDCEGRYFEDGARLLWLITNFTANEKMEFQSVRRMNDGTSKVLFSTETVRGGEESLPDKVHANVQIFVGGRNLQLEITLRYKINGGKLNYFLHVPQLADIKREEFEALVDQVRVAVNTHEGAGWQDVLVLEGTYSTDPYEEENEAKEHKGSPLPASIVAGGPTVSGGGSSRY